MARKFFFVCAGILCLALAYHLGAQNAKAENAGTCFFGSNQSRATVAYSDGTVWTNGGGPNAWLQTSTIPLGGNQLVVFTGAHAVTSDGRVWENENSYWQDLGPIPGGAVPVQSDSWGSVKTHYR